MALCHGYKIGPGIGYHRTAGLGYHSTVGAIEYGLEHCGYFLPWSVFVKLYHGQHIYVDAAVARFQKTAWRA